MQTSSALNMALQRRTAVAGRCKAPAPTGARNVAAAAGKLIVYTKPDCPLCDGLKVRDVSTDDDWAAAYAHEVPVLATEVDGKQVTLPRPMPRITADRLQKHIEEALTSLPAQS